MRDGRSCEDCLGKKTAWPGILHGCYRNSRAGSAVVASISLYHRYRRSTAHDADCYYTPTEFARQKFIQGGFRADKILVKSNSVDPDPGYGTGAGGHAVFAGRLSAEKGIDTLLDAWSQLALHPDCPTLKIIGDGPLAARVSAAASKNPKIQWLGTRPLAETLQVIGSAALLVMPSVWFETFGRTIIEAFANGTPVVASRLGAMAEIVSDGVTGLHFTPGDANDLAAKVMSLLQNREKLQEMRRQARLEYESKYTGQQNYQNLIQIYEHCIRKKGVQK
jgi:glycosyltransferase involved in cell wall biosynthesis